ncbi:hypothetical protein ES319_D05G158900v1 [Gossypium barbadense]|uniref:Uncharacterized protein n=1 Tax=Gossypium barbadense TaxID=3634 RepID=A0A5J5RGY1_GOSBA|nr:hypothetical protein ES319_D05G158900v1 [Gossypium barbadense]
MFLPPRATVIFFILLAVTIPEAVDFLSYSQYKTLVSLSQSLLTRVSNLRSARGDADGSNRARLIAEKLERWQGVGFWGAAWSVGWDYVWNYAWGSDLDYAEIFGVASDLNQLGRVLGELTRLTRIWRGLAGLLEITETPSRFRNGFLTAFSKSLKNRGH